MPAVLARHLGDGQEAGADQGVVELVTVARIGPRVRARRRDCGRIEHAERDRVLVVTGPPRLHRVRAPLFERGVIQERVRPRVDNLVRQQRRLGRIARHAADAALVNARQDLHETRQVHRLLQAILDGLRDQRVIGDLAIAGNVLEARGRIGKGRREQIVGAHPL